MNFLSHGVVVPVSAQYAGVFESRELIMFFFSLRDFVLLPFGVFLFSCEISSP